MPVALVERPTRLPRFRRASEPPAFRLTDDDVEIVRQLARRRFLRSTHIAELVGRSLDRTNDRLRCLYHAGYVDRPRAQLDYYPTAGSAPIVYALADRGARLLIERDGAAFANVEWSRKNREAGRPFIEHQIEIADFEIALRRAVRACCDTRLISADEMAAGRPKSASRHPFALRAKLTHRGAIREISVIPDFVFALKLGDGTRRNFMVEIDRGTMPVIRSDIGQTSVARKLRTYLAAHAARQHERLFGWRNFRVLTVVPTRQRINTIIAAYKQQTQLVPATLCLFADRRRLLDSEDYFAYPWLDADGKAHLLLG